MSSVQTFSPVTPPDVTAEEQARASTRRKMLRGELYALAVLIGLQMSVVYVIGTLVVACVGW